jgi:CheY-like chemotaxis protein
MSANEAGKRVMVVEDNEDSAEVLAEALRALGYAVEVAHEAASALVLAAKFRPHAALVDIGLPDKDGYELAQLLREQQVNSACHLIALTGYSQSSDRERSRAAGFVEHLVKPVEFDRLGAAIEAVIGRPDGPLPIG